MGAACRKPEIVDFDAEVNIGHFDICRIIGKGAFGKVIIVEHKKTKQEYALKYLSKEKCIKKGMTVHVIRERKLLEELDSPFVCNLRYAFQDDLHLLMALDLKLGGDIRFHLNAVRSFKEPRAKFYAAEIVMGLQYLHQENMIHRDIKPENVLLDSEGHACITDFNVACRYDPDQGKTVGKQALKNTSNSGKVLTCMAAPEMVSRQLYNETVDWWSLGILIYEMLFGRTPFRGHLTSDLYKAIVNDTLSYGTKDRVSREAKEIISGFLTRNPNARLGSKTAGGDELIKKLDWFKEIKWQGLIDRTYPVPFVPSVKVNCDPDLILDEVLLEDNKLSGKPISGLIAKRKNSEEFYQQLKLMEEKFTVFDFTKGKNASGNRLSVMDANEGLDSDMVRETRQAAVTVDSVVVSNPIASSDENTYENKRYPIVEEAGEFGNSGIDFGIPNPRVLQNGESEERRSENRITMTFENPKKSITDQGNHFEDVQTKAESHFEDVSPQFDDGEAKSELKVEENSLSKTQYHTQVDEASIHDKIPSESQENNQLNNTIDKSVI